MRRMSEFSYLLESKLNRGEVEVFFLYREGAKLNHVLDNINAARGYEVLVIMAGGNDLSSGAGRHCYYRYYHCLENQAKQMSINAVVITTLWPRADKFYNRMVYWHNEYMMENYWDHPFVTFWD